MVRFRSIILVFAAFLFTLCIAPEIASSQEEAGVSQDNGGTQVAKKRTRRSNMPDADGSAQAAEPQSNVVSLDDDGSEAQPAPRPARSFGPSASEDSPVKGHGLQLSVMFLGLPESALDIWFTNHGNTWDDTVNMGFSLDYFLRFKAPCELKFSLGWQNARTGDAYWLDKDFSDRPHLADYIVNHLSMISLEFAAYHVVSIIDEVAFYYGGGVWGGLLLGDVKAYAIRAACSDELGVSNECPHEPGSVDLTQMPPGFGFVTVSLGFKFILAQAMTIRVEGGFKGYLYGQLGLGVDF